MSYLMREEFEAACEARFNWATQYPYRDESESALSAWNGESYRSRMVQGMWWAWQASRECLVIDLPDRFDEHYQDYYEDVDGGCFNEGRYINDVHAALTAAGVKYK